MTERVFTIINATSVSGLSPANVAQMISRGRFQPSFKTRRGTYRPYTLRDIVHLAAIADLHAVGLSLGRAVEIAGVSAEGTAGRETIVHRHGESEIVLNVAGIAARVRNKLGLMQA